MNIFRQIIRWASQILVDASTFTGNLSSSDDTVQKALETLDAMEGGTDSGDMEKSTYDQNDNGRVDEAEAVNDGTSGDINKSTAVEVRDAVNKKHTSGSDDQIASTVPTEDSGISVQDALNTLEADEHTHIGEETTSNLSYYVDSVNGNDENPGTSGSPFLTLQKAFDVLPKIIKHEVIITLKDGIYNYTEIKNFVNGGGGQIVITSDSYNVTSAYIQADTRCLDIKSSSVPLYFDGVGIKINNSGGKAIYISDSSFIDFIWISGGAPILGESNLFQIENSRITLGLIDTFDSTTFSTLIFTDFYASEIIWNKIGTILYTVLFSSNAGGVILSGRLEINNTDYDDAIAKKHSNSLDHTQNTDTKLIGQLSDDNKSLNIDSTIAEPPYGGIVFCFDDGYSSIYTKVFPYFQSKGIVGTDNIVTDSVGSSNFTTWEELTTMYNAGWEMASHSKQHVDLTGLNAQALDDQLRLSKEALTSHGFDVVSMIYPFGINNQTVKSATGKYYKYGRAAGVYTIQGIDGFDYAVMPFPIRRYEIPGNSEGTNFNAAKGYIDYALAHKRIVIFYYHNVSDSELVTIGQIVDYVNSINMPVYTLREACETYANIIDIIDQNTGDPSLAIGVNGAVVCSIKQLRINNVLYPNQLLDIAAFAGGQSIESIGRDLTINLKSPSRKVGIGTTYPAEKLDVTGNIKLSGNITDGTNHSTPAEIKDTVNKQHTQNTDKILQQVGELTGYSDDLLVGGTPTASSFYSEAFNAEKACDGNLSTSWNDNVSGLPQWWKYDFGSGITQSIVKVRIKPAFPGSNARFKDFTIQGSNDDSSWDTLYTGQHPNNSNWEDYIFANTTPYRYYKINITTTWDDSTVGVTEIEMMAATYSSLDLINDGVLKEDLAVDAGKKIGGNVIEDITDAVSNKHIQNTDVILKTNDSGSPDLINDGVLKKDLLVDALIKIDGRDLSVDGVKIDGIEEGAEVNEVDSVNGAAGAVVLVASDIMTEDSGINIQEALNSLEGAKHTSGSDAETTTTIGALINGATPKTTPIDADIVGFVDTQTSNILKNLTWTNIKAFLKTYFDTLYSGGTLSKSFVITNPTSSSDSPLWRVPANITIIAVHVLCIGGTNIVGHLWEYDTNGANGSSVDSSDITGTAGSNVNDDGSLSNAGIASGNYLGWKTTSISGTVTKVIVSFDYTIN
jgi:peptidoglycan/xylan/chitin deacetylase (PgdA/CDA1 family)